MTRFARSFMRTVAVAGMACMLLSSGAYWAGARWNTTRSLPVGLYWTSTAPMARGTYVLWCPPRSQVFDEARRRGYIGAGLCPGGYGYLMKRVLGMPGDVIDVGGEGVRVNGRAVARSVPLTVDLGGRGLPHYRISGYRLGPSEVLLMSDLSATSFDGRYFGPVPRALIRSVVHPVLTW